MVKFKNPYISRIQIKNFRNFLNVDVELDHKQVIIGENNIGKTNFLRAIQLILDKDFSDNDRELTENDFHDSIVDPMINGTIIEITLQIRGYEHSSKLVAQFSDAVISADPAILQFTYRYFPVKHENGNIIKYDYIIFKGKDESFKFKHEDRSFINIYVIKALRDVERELKANKNSPLYKLVKKYEIDKDDLENISITMQKAAEEILELDEIIHIKKIIQERFTSLSGLQTDNEINLRTFDVDTEKLLYTLQVYMGLKQRPVSELSLGLANILYVSLMLILLKDRTISPIIKVERFQELLKNDNKGLLKRFYTLSEKDNYILNESIGNEDMNSLYSFMDQYNFKPQSFSILAVEEPESHLHPILQRLIYREVLHKSGTSVVFTSHSTFIASVAPLSSIVHFTREKGASKVYSTIGLAIDPREKKDIERYIDAKRGEIYFGKGIILVEGITEEYILPASATILGKPLDDYGIVVCNIDSTNFKPYIQVLNVLHIPWILFTDGDYYEIDIVVDYSGNKTQKRIHHILQTAKGGHYRGNSNVKEMLLDLNIIDEATLPKDLNEQEEVFKTKGCYIGKYTLEVDMMEESTTEGVKGVEIFKKVYSELITGAEKMLENFEIALDKGEYWKALKKIENNISKGRFAQRLSSVLIKELIPGYIEEGINDLIEKVSENHE